jgi:hypothetical protein
MAGIEDPIDLRVWSVATFRAVSFVIVVALTIHNRGTLAAALSNLNTALGLAFFAVLWTTTWIATRSGERYYRRRVEDERYSASRVEATIVAGGWNGVLIYLVPAVIGFVLLHNVGILVFSVLGAVIAFVIGGFVGLAYGIVETALRRLSDLLIGLK